MRAVLLAIASVGSLAAGILGVAIVPKGLLVAGFVVVAVAFVVLAGAHIRRATSDEVASGPTRSVPSLHPSEQKDGELSHGGPTLASSSARERRVA